MIELIGISLQKIGAWSEKFKNISLGLSDQRIAHERAMIFIDQWIQRNFRSSGQMAMGGSGWKPLAESTKMRRRHGTNKKRQGQVAILQDTGWLRRAWKHDFSPWRVAVQSMTPYGIYHDSDAPRKKLPQRRIVPRKKQVKDDIMRIYRNHMIEVIRRGAKIA